MADRYREALRAHLTPTGHTLGCPAPMGLDCTGPCRLTRDALAEDCEESDEAPSEVEGLEERVGEWLGVRR